MITTAYIAKVLVRMGYAFDEESCKRRLTDWRQKGLLPSLKVKGQQHHGKIYYWDTPEITAQAVTVCKLFELYYRSEWVLLSTWFAGYDIPLYKIREIWIKSLEGEINHFKKRIGRNEEMADVLSRVDRQILRQKRKSNPILKSEFYISLFTNIFYNPNFDLDDLGDENDIEKLIFILFPTISINEGKVNDLINVKVISNFFNDHFSLTARYDLIKHCSDKHLEQAHHNWRRAKPILRMINRIFSPDPSRISKEELQIQHFIGNCFIMMNLILRNLGYGSKFENALNEICVLLPSISVVEMKNKIQVRENNADDEYFAILREQIMSVWENTPMDDSEYLSIENHKFKFD